MFSCVSHLLCESCASGTLCHANPSIEFSATIFHFFLLFQVSSCQLYRLLLPVCLFYCRMVWCVFFCSSIIGDISSAILFYLYSCSITRIFIGIYLYIFTNDFNNFQYEQKEQSKTTTTNAQFGNKMSILSDCNHDLAKDLSFQQDGISVTTPPPPFAISSWFYVSATISTLFQLPHHGHQIINKVVACTCEGLSSHVKGKIYVQIDADDQCSYQRQQQRFIEKMYIEQWSPILPLLYIIHSIICGGHKKHKSSASDIP
ncbi:hypothetical protein O6H91_Y420800 [Diphasiastrum complanatum]|nr:hypothetical protein O6H91_Y420800 [Diphasiastrum complanatum]